MTNVGIEQIYFYLGIFSTALFILKLAIFMLAGGDIEVETDFDSMAETDVAFNFLSVQSILAFFMGFSWMGLTALTKLNTSETISILIALAVGVAFMLGTAYLMFIIRKLEHKTGSDLSNCVGTIGKAYTEFQSKGEGQIEATINKKLVIMDATSVCEEKIEAFSEIKIEKVENNRLYINKV